ncbi:MAG: hypothetical protein HY916_03140 [Desulfovibrio sp.]|nr:hypothetical protein [Desulfovibrio sp.]
MEYIDGQAVLKKYGISVGELVKAIHDGLPAYDAVTGKRVIDQDMMIACPKYETEEQAAKAVDYVDNMLAATRMSQGMPPFRDYSHSGAGYIDAVVRKDKVQLFLKNCKSYKFPEGYDQPQEPCGIFPLRYDTFHREYAEAVHLKMHGDNETVIGLYQKLIGAMRLPVAAVEERFRKASSDSGIDIRHVPLTPGQDWLGNTDPLLNRKQIARPISVFDLLARWSGASGESMGALSERLVRFHKHGALHLFEPQQKGPRILYAPSTKDAAAIEIDCAAASHDRWTEGSQAANDLSGLFADMAEVEALEAQYDSLKPIASDNSGQEPGQVAPMGIVEAEDTPGAKPTPENMLRMHQANPEKWTRKALGDKYFRNSPGENDETVKSRLQRYLAKISKRPKA